MTPATQQPSKRVLMQRPAGACDAEDVGLPPCERPAREWTGFHGLCRECGDALEARVRRLEEALGVAITALRQPWPKTDVNGCCVACGNWTPAGHPEAHDHEEGCAEAKRCWDARHPDIAALDALLKESTP